MTDNANIEEFYKEQVLAGGQTISSWPNKFNSCQFGQRRWSARKVFDGPDVEKGLSLRFPEKELLLGLV